MSCFDASGEAALSRHALAKTNGHGNPNWTRDEIILALDLYFELAGVIPAPTHPKLVALSDCLRGLAYHAVAARRPTFRNPQGVSFKLQNLRQVATGGGFENTSKLDWAVWQELGQDPSNVRALAAKIRQAAELLEAGPLSGLDEEEFAEGGTASAVHRGRERNPAVRRKVIAARKAAGRLTCDICGTGPTSAVAEYADAMFEAHHTLSLTAGERRTRVGDMALLCANCHRLLHRAIAARREWIPIEAARGLLHSVQDSS